VFGFGVGFLVSGFDFGVYGSELRLEGVGLRLWGSERRGGNDLRPIGLHPLMD